MKNVKLQFKILNNFGFLIEFFNFNFLILN